MDKSKKISLLISSLAGGGAEGVCVSIANGLAQRGWCVDLVVLHLNNAAYLDRVSPLVNLVALNVDHARYALLPIRRYLKANDVGKVIVFNYELAVVLVLLRLLFSMEFRLIARNVNTFSSSLKNKSGVWKKFVVTPLVRVLYGRVDHVVNQCFAMERDLLVNYPGLKGRTSVVYNPVNPAFECVHNRCASQEVDKDDYFLCVGRLEAQKGFHFALQAFSRLVHERPLLRLKIVGIGRLEQDLRALAHGLGIERNVDFEGFQKDLVPYYLGAKATLLTSMYEGFPNVLIESIAVGTPVISFDCPSGPSEIIIENVNGYLVNHMDVDDLYSKMKFYEALDARGVRETSFRYSLTNAVKGFEVLIGGGV